MYNSTDLLEQLSAANLSKFQCTVRGGYTKAIEDLEEARLENLRKYFSEEQLQKFRSYEFGEFIARVYSHASVERAGLIYDMIVWLWLIDDLFDKSDVGKDKDASVNLQKLAMQLTWNEPIEDDYGYPGLVGYSQPMYRRFQELASYELFRRYAFTMQEYILAMGWQVEYRTSNTFPDVPSYKRMRRYTGAQYPSFVLNEFAIEQEVPLEVRENYVIKKMVNIATDMISWANDVASLRAEIKDKEFFNLVLLIYLNEKPATLQEALDGAIELINDHERRILSLQDKLPHLSAQKYNGVAILYIDCILKWVRGNYDWSLTCGRYNK